MTTKSKPYPLIEELECKGCGNCTYACPLNLLKLGETINKRGYVSVQYSGTGCIGCGNCFYACPEFGAIEVINSDED